MYAIYFKIQEFIIGCQNFFDESLPLLCLLLLVKKAGSFMHGAGHVPEISISAGSACYQNVALRPCASKQCSICAFCILFTISFDYAVLLTFKLGVRIRSGFIYLFYIFLTKDWRYTEMFFLSFYFYCVLS